MKTNNNNDNTMKKTWSNSCYSMCNGTMFQLFKKHAIDNKLVLHPKPNIPHFLINLKFVVLVGWDEAR